MKNILKVFKKSFIGVPVAIFIYEMFNLAISIVMKQYVKIDGFNLQRLICDYIEFGMVGYGYSFMLNYIKYNIKNSDQNEIQKSRRVINVFGVILILIILIMSIIDNDLFFGCIVIAMLSLLILVILFILFLFDKKEVNTINNKIKEKEVNKDKKG